METEEEFQENFKLIYSLACKNGQDKVKLDFSKPIDNKSKKIFISECHKGFNKAQNLIIDVLINYENDLELNKKNLKQYRSIRDEQNVDETNNLIRTIEYRKYLIRKLADSIAWQLIGGQNYIARRLYLGESPPTLSTSNYSSVRDTANFLNSKCTLDFALVSDLTSFIQIGDIFLRKQNEFHIIEVKEGPKNTEAIKIIEKLRNENIDIKDENLEFLNDKELAKQVSRFNRQIIRGHKASDLLSNEEGFDPKTNFPVKITEYSESIAYFYSTIHKLLEKSKEKDWAYEVIDNGILLIGAYRKNFLPFADLAIKELIKEQTNKNYPVFDFIQNLRIPITEPIFTKPLKDEHKFDIVFGNARIIMALDFDKVIEVFNDLGVNAKWLSKKETHKYKESKTSGLLIIDNQAIGLEYKGFHSILGDAFVSRIISDNMTPFSAILAYIKILEEMSKNIRK